MEFLEALETYLTDSRQIDALAKRQARLLCRSVAEASHDDAYAILLLNLAALAKGSPRPDKSCLMKPLEEEVIHGHARQHEDANPGRIPLWKDLRADPANVAPVEKALDRLFKDPASLSPLTGPPPACDGDSWPVLVVNGGSIGFSRYWQAAALLDSLIAARLYMKPDTVPIEQARMALSDVFVKRTILSGGQRFHFRQCAAAALSLRTRFVVISGGPGTGKTSVVIQILRALVRGYPGIAPDRIALCAPTGRAKARLGESLDKGLDALSKMPGSGDNGADARERALRAAERKTLHSLLGMRPDGSFRYDRRNPLPHQVVIVDEASMVDECLFAALMNALSSDCRVILVGDMHQLPSVEAGAVLGDLTERFSGDPNSASLTAECALWVHDVTSGISLDGGGDSSRSSIELNDGISAKNAGALADHTVILTQSYRAAGAILELSAMVNRGEHQSAIEFLKQGNRGNTVVHDDRAGIAPVEEWLKTHWAENNVKLLGGYRGLPMGDKNGNNEPVRRMVDMVRHVLAGSTILTLTHEGPRGCSAINNRAETVLRPALDRNSRGRFFHGQPVILNVNRHDLDLYNGDLGMMVRTDDNGMKVCFPRGTGYIMVALERLSGLDPAFALTVHKAQGSEFNHVLFVLPEYNSPLLSRQIVYTALTRARESVRILGDVALFGHAIQTTEQRVGGVSLF
jgi:exodeoxyribonuclease V alpha subunit